MFFFINLRMIEQILDDEKELFVDILNISKIIYNIYKK